MSVGQIEEKYQACNAEGQHQINVEVVQKRHHARRFVPQIGHYDVGRWQDGQQIGYGTY